MFNKKNVLNNQQQLNKYQNGNTTHQQIRNNLNLTCSSSINNNMQSSKANVAPELTYSNILDLNHSNINYNNKLSNQNECFSK
jgi:hypothetical protein